MSLGSDSPTILDCHATETTAPRTGPNPIDAATGSRSRRRETDDSDPVSGTRTRLVSLRADVELLEAERAALANRVLALEADVAELEAEVESLEGSVECEAQRRQRVIDTYERVIEAKEAANRELRDESEATTREDTDGRGPLPAIRSSVETVCTRLRRVVPIG